MKQTGKRFSYGAEYVKVCSASPIEVLERAKLVSAALQWNISKVIEDKEMNRYIAFLNPKEGAE